ncbi:MAG TPA: hypothetical protein VIK18_12875 [Pirellulales bacterium]
MDRAATQAGEFVNQKLVAKQLAYLEHDARVLASAMTGGSLDSILSLQPAARDGPTDPPRLAR